MPPCAAPPRSCRSSRCSTGARASSGGQQQRVALGRCIVRNPKVFLFDEPLSNLDAQLRAQMRLEIKELRQRVPTTSGVRDPRSGRSHDARRPHRRHEGRPGAAGRQPARRSTGAPLNRFVASFIGSPAMNFIDMTVAAEADSFRLSADGMAIELPQRRFAGLGAHAGRALGHAGRAAAASAAGQRAQRRRARRLQRQLDGQRAARRRAVAGRAHRPRPTSVLPASIPNLRWRPVRGSISWCRSIACTFSTVAPEQRSASPWPVEPRAAKTRRFAMPGLAGKRARWSPAGPTRSWPRHWSRAGTGRARHRPPRSRRGGGRGDRGQDPRAWRAAAAAEGDVAVATSVRGCRDRLEAGGRAVRYSINNAGIARVGSLLGISEAD